MVSKFYRQVFLFWFVLLLLAFINAIVREITYKPLLEPYIGFWAHQISSVTGICLFFAGIYLFLKHVKTKYGKKELVYAGFLWILMTVIFESIMNYFVRKLDFWQILETYYFWKGETWIFVLLSLIVSPMIADRLIRNRIK